MPGYFLNIFRMKTFCRIAGIFYHCPCHRVRRITFQCCSQLYHLILIKICRNNFLYFKYTFSERTRFVHHHRIYFRHHIKEITPFEKDAVAGSKANAAKITQRNGNHQCTRATDHQENQCTVKPVIKNIIIHNEIRDNRNSQRQCKHDRRINFCKTADK